MSALRTMDEAAQDGLVLAIGAHKAEIERLRAALKPFADWYEQYQWGEYPRDMSLPDEQHVAAWGAAREALQISRRLTPHQQAPDSN